ncbi:MAG: hypothetical protein U0V48_10420 [Anaerolineales bacterium]
MKEERFAGSKSTAKRCPSENRNDQRCAARIGEIKNDSVLGRLDSAENILANKVTALLDREEPKDLADIWGFCCQKDMSLQAAITGAQSKAAGVFPADLGRILCSVQHTDWESIRWIQAPPAETFISQLNQLGKVCC